MLTLEQIKGLGPKGQSYRVLDSDGLSLHIRPSGLKSWSVRYQVKGRPANLNVGRWPEVGITEARARRNKIKDAARGGLTPAEAEQLEQKRLERGATVQQFGDRYMREIVKRVRKDSAPIERYLKRDVYPDIGEKRMADVSLYDLRCLIFRPRDEGHHEAALALRDLLKRMWDYAVICGLVTSNPLQALQPKFIAKSVSRIRSLTPREVGEFVHRLEASRERASMKAGLFLLLLSLTRKTELLQARWEHIDLHNDEWQIPAEHAKNGKPHSVYLSRQARGVLQQLARAYPGGRPDRKHYVIHAPASKTQPISESTLNGVLCRVAQGMEHFTVHDLRRTGATLLSEYDYPADVIEKALNHTIKGVRGVYNRAQYRPQRQRMLQDWADKVEHLASEHRASPDQQRGMGRS